MSRYDYIVIGAGMAGASVGYELSRSGTVLVLERESAPGYHATGRSAAMFTEAYGNATVRALTCASRAFYDHPPAGFAEHPLLAQRGVLFVASAQQLDRLQTLYAEVSGLPVRVTLEDGAMARRSVPILRAEAAIACLWEPDARDIDVHAVLQGYLRGLRAQGGQLRTGAEVVALSRGADDWRVRTAAESFQARVVVNAAGAWAGPIARLAGAAAIVLTPMRRTACLVDVPAGIDARTWPMVVDADERCYFKPDAGRLLVSPADATPSEPSDARPEELDIAVAIERFERLTTVEVERARTPWAGLRTFASDASPVCGYDPHRPGFFWLAGQGGYGIQMAPALARAAASMVRGEDLPPDILGMGLGAGALSPRRFGEAGGG
jgi:D-arginine dehydrogenase